MAQKLKPSTTTLNFIVLLLLSARQARQGTPDRWRRLTCVERLKGDRSTRQKKGICSTQELDSWIQVMPTTSHILSGRMLTLDLIILSILKSLMWVFHNDQPPIFSWLISKQMSIWGWWILQLWPVISTEITPFIKCIIPFTTFYNHL